MIYRKHPWQHILAFSLAVCMQTVQVCSALVVSEIMYNPSDESLEFIELYNHRAVFEDISGRGGLTECIDPDHRAV